MKRPLMLLLLRLLVLVIAFLTLPLVIYFVFRDPAERESGAGSVRSIDEEWVCPETPSSSPKYDGKCLKLVKLKRSWDKANRYCMDSQQQDALLISIGDEWEERTVESESTHCDDVAQDAVIGVIKSAVVNQSSSCEFFWIGGSLDRESNKVFWVDGRLTSFNNSLEVLLGGVSTQSSRLAVSSAPTHRWVTFNESEEHCFICLWDSRQSFPDANDCDDLASRGKTRSGVYKIRVSERSGLDEDTDKAKASTSSKRVLCEMETSAGGWTVFQQRIDGNTVFWNRTWQEYKNGFGLLAEDGNFWLGNDLLHTLTTKGTNVTLRVELMGDRNPTSDGYTNDYLESEYCHFSVDSEGLDYAFHASSDWPGVGNASFGWYDITVSSGRKFSTIDRINDPMPECVIDYHLGGWWLHYCSFSSLNGEYVPPIEWGNGYGMNWITSGIYIINPRKSRMMLRKSG